ncbi:serine hydrolase domain-containing protein [Nocardiopsis aegyptia]|uniref:serine hydrolase domain-containing protein n=1 Tax=Nocardiopsis aegyptia TaxID=220378 RepID=UPI0036733D6C
MLSRAVAVMPALALALALLVLIPPVPPAGAESVGSSGADGPLTAEAVDAYVEDYVESSLLPGATVAVTRGTEVVRVAGYGTDSRGEPMTADTPMGAASLSKAFTALAVLQLVEDGALGLDDRVVEHLDEFAMADPRSTDITVGQLLTHTSGMSDTAFREKSEPAPPDLEGAVARLAGAELVADPGEEYHYHNPNYHVAARLVEVVSGRSFGDFLDERVFGPLGMSDTVSVDTAAEVFEAGVATGHIGVLGRPVAIAEPDDFYNGAGGMVTTASDMARWLIAQNNGGVGPDGGRVLSAEGIERSRTAPGGDAPGRDSALGWSTRPTSEGTPMVSHGGVQFTYTAYHALLPENGYGIAVMANTGLGVGDASALLHGLVALADGEEPAAPLTPVLLGLDVAMAVLVALTALLAVRGVRRAGAWASAARDRVWWRTASRLLPGVVVMVAAMVPHRLLSPLAGGRDVPWAHVFYLVPGVFTALMAAAVAFAVVYAVRAVRLVRSVAARRARGRAGGEERPGSAAVGADRSDVSVR